MMGNSLGIRTNCDTACCFRMIQGGGIRLIWEITSRCNLQCHHCFARDNQAAELDPNVCLKIIQEFSRINVKKVMFTGGEPFLRQDIFNLIEMSANVGVTVDVVTNGLLLEPKKIRRLTSAGLTELTISLDGPEQVHDYIRGQRGAFAKVTRCIQELLEKGILVDIVCVVTKNNIYSISQLVDIVSQLQCSSLTLSGLCNKELPLTRYQQLALSQKELDELSSTVFALRNRPEMLLPIRTVGLINRPAGKMDCSQRRMMAIDRWGKIRNCLLAPGDKETDPDAQSGLSQAWQHMDRQRHCGRYQWAVQTDISQHT